MMKLDRTLKYLWIIVLLIIVLFIMYIVSDDNSNKNKEITPLTPTEKAWLEENSPLIYSADNNAPPLRYVDPADGQYKGVVIDYVNLLSLNIGVGIEVHPLLWEDALVSLKEGESALCDMFRSDEREQYFLFTDPIYNLRAVVATRLPEKPINEMTFATQKGDYVNEWLIKTYPDIQLTQVNDLSSALNLLNEGKVDAVAGDEPVLLNQIQNKNFTMTIHILEKPLYENQVVFAVPKSKPELVSILNKGIAYIGQSGQLESIQQKWFGISAPIVKEQDYSERIRRAILGAGMLGIILLGMITWNYLLTQEVNRRTKEVVNSKNDLQITFDGMTEYIVLFDSALCVANINKSFADKLDKSKQELVGENFKDIFAAFKSEELIDMIRESFEKKSSGETEQLLNNNYYIIRTFPLEDDSGKTNKLLVIIQNITKEKISEKQMLQSNKMEAIGQLAAGMAHEIRNPLGIIRNHSYIMRARNDNTLFKSLNYIDSAVERASRIIDNLLKFSRLTDDKLDHINMFDLINKVLEIEESQFSSHKITHVLKCDPNLTICSNAESLKHILFNLISNAIDAIEKEGVIEIDCYKADEYVVLGVKDNGKGLTDAEVENIFNPFYTTKDPDKGTGLGLYIVYNEVKKLNGDIHVENGILGYTAFRIYLPSRNNEEVVLI